jgi:hypothetical protein
MNTDGTRIAVAPSRGPAFSLAELQAVVGGYIEAVRLQDGSWMFVNEDGKRLQLPLNRSATLLAQTWGFLPPWDQIVGDVIVMTTLEAGGADEALEERG